MGSAKYPITLQLPFARKRMANPQKEHGHIEIANELFEAFYLHKFTEYQRVIIMFIWRKTYGWGKKEDSISNSQFVEGTGIKKGNVSRTLKELRSLNVVICTDNKLAVNKNWEEWKVICRGNKSYLYREQKLSVQQVQKTKKYKKNTLVAKNLVAERDEGAFSFLEEHKKLQQHDNKLYRIIAFYWSKKNWHFDNQEQFDAELSRDLRPAKLLLGYTPQQIIMTVEWCQDQYGDKWTLETVGKKLPDVINKRR